MAGIDSAAKLVLHMNGADASTTFTDSSASAHKVTANGNAQIDTAQYKWTSSGLFDGNADYLSIPDSDDWYLGTGAYAIDFWFRPNALPGVSGTMIFLNQHASATHRHELSIYNDSGTYYLNYDVNNVSVFWRAATLATGNWYHLAITRDASNNARIFLDGTQLGATVTDAYTIENLAAEFRIGANQDGTGAYNGWIDEFRISKGVARWVSNFTPPTEEYSEDAAWEIPAIALTDSFLTPQLNTMFPPALSAEDSFVAPTLERIFLPSALSRQDTFAVPGLGRTEFPPYLSLVDTFKNPRLSVPIYKRTRTKVNLV